MEQTDLKIKAKKISELDNFNDAHNIIDNGKDAWIILAYTENNKKENYKVNLSTFVELISNSTLLNMQDQIDELRSLINSYNQTYKISTILSGVLANSSNPTSIKSGGEVSLSFSPEIGYNMPDNINVDGADYNYNQSNGTVKIFGVHENTISEIKIYINGVLKHFTLSFNLTHINYEILSDQPSQGYTILSDNIRIQLSTINENYELPNSVNISNASLISYNKDTGILTIKCNGSGNMSVSATAKYIDTTIYYWGVIAKGINDQNVLNYNSSGEPNNILSVDSLYSSSGDKCPINYSLTYTIYDEKVWPAGYGDEEIYIILPLKYFNKTAKKFVDDSGNQYDLYNSNIFPISFGDDIVDLTYNSVSYVALTIQYEGTSYPEIHFKK